MIEPLKDFKIEIVSNPQPTDEQKALSYIAVHVAFMTDKLNEVIAELNRADLNIQKYHPWLEALDDHVNNKLQKEVNALRKELVRLHGFVGAQGEIITLLLESPKKDQPAPVEENPLVEEVKLDRKMAVDLYKFELKAKIEAMKWDTGDAFTKGNDRATEIAREGVTCHNQALDACLKLLEEE